ncbi:TPM domain-containing protein [Blattabacterium cuenoti]|uniref:TPM domain-containing protein n=1 Tax=Blattabacterium cuenoti TaxID=1653831 RepID=UPI00163CA487|nr:TPM domain-containing protein [Blattabacterium cuenoti]
MNILIKILFIIIPITIVNGQFNIPNHKQNISPIQDYSNVLSKEELHNLNKKLLNYFKITSTEILIILIRDLNGEDPNVVAYKWGERWRIGQFYKNNGIVILLSINDKKISIQNGYGVESYLTDFLTKKIINNIKPYLKNNLYYEAIDNCINDIFKILKNNFVNKKPLKKKKHSLISWIYVFVFFVMIFIFYKNGMINTSLLNTLLITNLFLSNKNNFYEEDEDEFDGLGGGGNFGGGGSSDDWK